MINVRDIATLQALRPFLVAHRGGVITPGSPENSLRAIQLAAQHGYAMVELDVMEAADHEPVLIHDGLYINCGVNKPVHTLTSEEIAGIRYRASDQTVIPFAQAIEACATLDLGVMLDKLAKDDPDDPAMSPQCLERVAALIERAGLASATLAIVDGPALRDILNGVTLFPLPRGDTPIQDMADGRFWFGWAAELTAGGGRNPAVEKIAALHKAGRFAIVSINTFHYPHHAPRVLAQQDIARLLAAGTDGFQIDSVYKDGFDLEKQSRQYSL